MKKLLSLTAAALLLITTGCGRSNAPPASASSGTPSVSAPITEPTVESSDDTAPTVQKDEAAAKPQNSRRLDDSRIIPLYSGIMRESSSLRLFCGLAAASSF